MTANLHFTEVRDDKMCHRQKILKMVCNCINFHPLDWLLNKNFSIKTCPHSFLLFLLPPNHMKLIFSTNKQHNFNNKEIFWNYLLYVCFVRYFLIFTKKSRKHNDCNNKQRTNFIAARPALNLCSLYRFFLKWKLSETQKNCYRCLS